MRIHYKTKEMIKVSDLWVNREDLGRVFSVFNSCSIDESIEASFLLTHYDTHYMMTNLESWITYPIGEFKEEFEYAYVEWYIIESIVLE